MYIPYIDAVRYIVAQGAIYYFIFVITLVCSTTPLVIIDVVII